MNTTNAWATVAQRELSVRLRNRTFILSTVLTLLLIVAVVGFQVWNGDRDQEFDLAVTPEATSMGQVVQQAAPGLDEKVTVDLLEVDGDDAAERAVRDGSADAWLHPGGDGWTLTGNTEVPDQLGDIATTAISQSVLADHAERAGTDLATLQEGSVVGTAILDGDAQQRGIAKAVGFVMAMLFYTAAIIFGMYLAMSVTEEKQSRIVEIIATSIPLRQLLFGKLIAAVALAVGQILLYVVVAIIGVSFTPWGDLLPGFTAGLAWFVLFFLFGFTLIAALYAVAGALASRQEDIQSTSLPVTILIMAMFFGAIFASGRVVEVLAWVPPFSAILQPMRLVSGDAQWWEALVSLGLLAAATLAVILVAERTYRRALMQTSGRLSFRQAWRTEV